MDYIWFVESSPIDLRDENQVNSFSLNDFPVQMAVNLKAHLLAAVGTFGIDGEGKRLFS